MQMPYIYVSCANKDLPEVQKLIEKLKAKGFRVICDNESQAGTEWLERIAKQIKDSSCFLLFLTEQSVKSQSVCSELDFAVSQGKKIVTVCMDEVSLPPFMAFKIHDGTVIFGKGNADQILAALCKIDAVMDCRKGEDLSFYKAELTKASGCPELPQEKAGSRCSVCGQLLSEDARFCYCCGSARGASGAAVAPPPATNSSYSAVPNMGKKSSSASVKAPSSDSFVPIRKKSFSERFRDFLSGNKMTDVNFSVLTPAVFEKERYTMVDVYAYEEDFRHVVEKVKAERAKREGELQESDGGHLQVKKGARITVHLSSPDLEITEHEETRVWTGKYAKFEFPVFVPAEYKKMQILFCADVYFDDVIATHIRFVVSCVGITEQRPKLEQKDVHSAFISYASGDRERVALILQGMRRSRPDLDVFFDVETLKTGESWEQILRAEIDKRDILYLCWSQLAKESEWVDKEWRYALKQKGLDGIEPIPLVLPKDCPPPEELKEKHFGARELYYQ